MRPLRWALGYLATGLVAGAILGAVVQAGESPLIARPKVTLESFAHPSGPTSLRTYRRDAESPPYLFEYQHVRAGTLLEKRMRLLHTPSGMWMIQQYDGDLRPLRGSASAQNAHPWEQTVSDGRCRWRVITTREYAIDPPHPGLSSESEAALDLALELIGRCSSTRIQ